MNSDDPTEIPYAGGPCSFTGHCVGFEDKQLFILKMLLTSAIALPSSTALFLPGAMEPV